MKINKMVALFFILTVVTALISACSSSNSPSSPSGPADTATFTSTFTATCGNATGTCTATPTNTFTNTFTPTNSFTPTHTPTNTHTSTPSNTPTDTLSPTPTGSATYTNTAISTATYTFTFSPTVTPTNTTFVCYTPVPTNTPNAGTYSIAGTLSDTTVGPTYDSAHPLVILLPGGVSGNPPVAYVDSNSGSYGPIGVSPSGSYYIVYWYNTVGDGHVSYPHVGDYAAINGTATCILGSGTPVNVNGVLTGRNYSLSNTNQLYGYAGTISYSGGTVDYCHQLHVEIYQPNTVTAHNSSTAQGSNGANDLGDANNGGIFTSGVRYDGIPYKSSSTMCSAQNVDILAYYDISGTSGSIQSGDPYVLYSNVATSLSATNNISLSNLSSTW